MKKFSFTSLWSVATLAIATLVLCGIATKAFAYTDADYLAFTPSGCSSSSMSVLPVGPTDFVSPFAIGANKIYVLTGGTYTLTQDINMSNCSVFITDGNAVAPIIFDFQGGKSFIDNEGDSNFTIRGINDSHMLEIKGTTSMGAILLSNSSGVTISYTQISGFTLGGIIFDHVINSTISNNNITNNLDGINFQGNSLNNIISNNIITYNTNNGIWLQGGSNGQTISNNSINSNILNGVYVDGSNANIISNNTGNSNGQYGMYFNSCQSNTGTNNIFTNSVRGIYVNSSQKNTLSNNTVKNNTLMGLSIDSSSSNTFTNNTISNNTYGLAIDNSSNNTFTNNTIVSNSTYGLYLSTASGNVFNGGDISSNTGTNVYLETSSNYNQFISTTIKSSTIGLQLDNSKYNKFNGVIIADNGSGTILNTASNNTFSLTNNTNGIYLNMNSNNNNILNTQILGQNNISISNGANNIITGGLFTAASTTSTSVNINLRNNQGTPNYTITGAGLSGTYPTTAMTGSTGTVAIELTTTNNEVKNIAVTYNNGNTQSDSIYLGTIVIPPTGNGGNGGGGGGGGTPTCTTTNLVCTNGVRTLKTGAMCQGGNLGLACTVSTGTSTTTGTLIGSIVGSTYSTEINNAYLWSYANGITTMNTIQKANMGSKLIRSHMAKMISNFAIKFGGLTPDTTKSCTFDDVAGQTAEMKFYIKLSCQLGLMGQNMDSFDPNTYVTRAQFGTILSRVIWGDTYNGGTTYYTKHLTALKNAGIMTQISTPSMKEIRGYVMLMMMRTYEGGFLNN